MSEHTATIAWSRETPDFTYDTYVRDHQWTFGSGSGLDASAAPEFKGSATLVNPEEAFVAALSSCHMLTFLALAAKKRLVVNAYHDAAIGHLEKNAAGKLAMTKVTLRPKVAFDGEAPTVEQLDRLHSQAHEHCFIANSVNTEVTIVPG